jgi:CheY-like chemotaxis protein
VPTILYIENDRASIDLVRTLLAQDGGLELIAATSGAEGIRLAQEQCPQMILLDLLLPDLDGNAVLEQLKGAAPTQDIPVVALTFVRPEDEPDLRRDLLSDYIMKPLTSPPAFLAAIHRGLKMRARDGSPGG